MTKGILLYDKKDSVYNSWFIKKLITEGAKEGLVIDLVITEDIASDTQGIDESNKTELNTDDLKAKLACYRSCDFAIMRNRSAVMASVLEDFGIKCFNSSEVIRLGNDKWQMYEYFKQNNIPVMHTQKTKLPYPFVLKPADGHGGENVYFINKKDEYERVCDNIDKNSYIYQMPASETGRDIRVYVLGKNILTAMERTSDTDFRANFSLGGNAREYALASDELTLAAKVADLVKPDFIGIDLIYNNGTPVVNEIEDAVGTRILYKYTDIDAGKEYIKYIAESI